MMDKVNLYRTAAMIAATGQVRRMIGDTGAASIADIRRAAQIVASDPHTALYVTASDITQRILDQRQPTLFALAA